MKALVEAGELGRVGTVRRRHCINFLFNPPTGPTRWHIDPIANVGMFFDDAVHAADFLYWLLGPPLSVMAEIDNVLTNVAPDDTGAAIYRFPDGAFGLLYNSSVTLAGENTTEIYGDRGVLLQNYGDGVSTVHAPDGASPLRLFRHGAPGSWEAFPLTIPRQHGERIGEVPRPWISRLRSGDPPQVTARDGRVSTAMCLAAYRSAREGRRVRMEELEDGGR
jgi:predicted dehydrogenase